MQGNGASLFEQSDASNNPAGSRLSDAPAFTGAEPSPSVQPARQAAVVPPAQPTSSQLVTYGEDELGALLPKVDDQATKYTRGSMLVIGGSSRFTGAPILAALAAARAGAGYVTLMVPDCMEQIARSHLLSIPVIAAPSVNGSIMPEAVELVTSSLNHLDCIVVGPGMGASKPVAEFVRKLLTRAQVPVVADADAINVVAGMHIRRSAFRPNEPLEALLLREYPTVFTPHDGELARLATACRDAGGRNALPMPDDRDERAMLVAHATNATVVAKGHRTFVADSTRHTDCGEATAALSKAGTGDVLAGVVGSFIAQGVAPFEASVLGVAVHSLAGECARQKRGMLSTMAEDVLECLSEAIMLLED